MRSTGQNFPSKFLEHLAPFFRFPATPERTASSLLHERRKREGVVGEEKKAKTAESGRNPPSDVGLVSPSYRRWKILSGGFAGSLELRMAVMPLR